MKQAFLMSVLPSKTGLVRIVNGRVLIRPQGFTVTFTANCLRLPAIATDRCRDVFIYESTRYDCFSIAGDRPRRTRFHSNLNIYDHAFAQRQIDLFEDDLKQSRRIPYEEWRNRPWAEKITEHALGLLRSQM